LKQPEQIFTFSGIGSKPVLSALRGLSAPVKRAGKIDAADQLFLARHDADLVSRWQAINALELSALCSLSRAVQNSDELRIDEDLVQLKAELAGDETLDPHFRALALAVPTESEIARELGENVDVYAIHKARGTWIKAIAGRVVNSGLHANILRPQGAFEPDAQQAGARAIANSILELECIATSDPQLAFEAYQASTNMTDRLAALTILAGHFPEAAQTTACLAEFRKRFDGNALVLDKWLVLVASMPGTGALERVKNTMSDPVYDANNPNRVRSLIGTFAMANPTGFHRQDGSAYDFFANEIVEMDRRNPQVAARVMTSVRSWRALEPHSREKLREAIAKIVRNASISRDLADIAGRTLG
jgi:aminopeptidase N